MACKVVLETVNEHLVFKQGELYVSSKGVCMCIEETEITDDLEMVDFVVIYTRTTDWVIGKMVCEYYSEFKRFSGKLFLTQD